MSQEPFLQQSTVSRAGTYDAGLRAHFQKVYNTMAMGLVVTGAVAYLVSHSLTLIRILYGSPIVAIALAFAPMLFMTFAFRPSSIMRKTAAELTTLFYAFSAVFGVSMSVIFLAYAGADIARVFFITAGMFAATSLYGYQTKKDLSGLNGLMMMGAFGLLIAMIVNMFLHSSMVQFVISVIGVVVYTGLVAWDTQQLKESYNASSGSEANGKMAVLGALSLYINFLMIFQFMLSLMGNQRR